MSYAHDVFLAEEIGNNVHVKSTTIVKGNEIIENNNKPPSKPYILNYHLNDPNRWYAIVLPKIGTEVWSLRCRDKYDLYYSYSPAHNTYMTLPSGLTLSEDTAPHRDKIYVMCKYKTIVEVEVWVR